MRRGVSKLLAVLLLGCGLSAAGKTYYVSSAGNDRNPGTLKAPWKTIGFAAGKAAPGDTVRIAPGIYREQIVFKKSGKKGAPITFTGSRGKNGEFLTIIEGLGTTLDKWQPAPEIGPFIWKTDVKRRPDLVMMDGRMITLINRLTMALPRWKTLPDEIDEAAMWSRFGPDCKRIPGFDLLAMKKDILLRHRYLGKRKESFWPAIGFVMTGWSKGKLYIRFADGSTPDKHRIVASYGAGFALNNVSHLRFSNLHMRGSRYQIRIMGRSLNNEIDNCLLMHGGARVRIDNGAENTIVRDSILTAGFIRGDLFQQRSRADMRGGMLYEIFKYIIGTSLSDDVGVQNRGAGTTIRGNVILQGLIGTEINAPGCEFSNNVIMQMSSVGLYTRPRTVGRFHHNLYINNGIPIRIHELRHERVKRAEYHYNNVIIQAPRDGSHVYVHCESHRWGDDMINFEPGTRKYKKNPPKPVDPGKFYIYHNTFRGGQESSPGFYVGYYYRRFRSVMPFVFINNVIKGCHWWEPFSQEVLAGNLLYGYPGAENRKPLRYPDVKKNNRMIPETLNNTLWNNKKIAGFHDLTLAQNSPAIGIGIDVSKNFVFNGKTYPALPGFAPGYFKGKAPAAGAFQPGESQQLFNDMFRRAEKARAIIKNAK